MELDKIIEELKTSTANFSAVFDSEEKLREVFIQGNEKGFSNQQVYVGLRMILSVKEQRPEAFSKREINIIRQLDERGVLESLEALFDSNTGGKQFYYFGN